MKRKSESHQGTNVVLRDVSYRDSRTCNEWECRFRTTKKTT